MLIVLAAESNWSIIVKTELQLSARKNFQSNLILLVQQKYSPNKIEYQSYKKEDKMPANMKEHSFIKGLKNRCSHLLHHQKTNTDSPQHLTINSRAAKLTLNPSREEVLKWAESLDNLLAHKYGLVAFKAFLKSEYNDENIEFWLACEDYKKIKSTTKQASKAKKIFSDFVEPMSPKEINLDYYTKDMVTKNLQHPTYTCFEAAQKKIYGLMENNGYNRFLQSDIYQNILNNSHDDHQT
ncbi:regulator of G-protein signaling 21-like [Carcharodon carcharias]|uniref:regulator of G-protein signaling 21-like n=1 Tax=Carcharodon carcharias TaxID=13397 RepID=UPI001B7DF831|nr:regulator of G-protein signaling 21-like [Carcharodon carcharias]